MKRLLSGWHDVSRLYLADMTCRGFDIADVMEQALEQLALAGQA